MTYNSLTNGLLEDLRVRERLLGSVLRARPECIGLRLIVSGEFAGKLLDSRLWLIVLDTRKRDCSIGALSTKPQTDRLVISNPLRDYCS